MAGRDVKVLTVHTQLTSLNSEIGKMLRSMHEQFLAPNA